MGYFGYKFVSLTPEEVATRRVALDYHARIAQLSQLGVIVLLASIRLGSILLQRWSRGDLESRPSSPLKKYLSEGRKEGLMSRLDRQYRTIRWQLGNEFLFGYGTWGQWIGGLLWTCWLAFLCFVDTKPDYMHFTKRFGIVAASQLPLHYLLAMKSRFSPIQLLLGKSHESLNRIHQVLGRIIVLFLFSHAFCYLNFFIRIGVLQKRIQDRDVILGLFSITTFLIIMSTAIGFVRRWNYRLFYTIHVVGPAVVLLALFFHVKHVRIYVVEAGACLALNLFLRIFSSKQIPIELSMNPGSSLVRISTSSNTTKSWKPGQHVYLRRSTKLLSYLRSNPFTISTLSTDPDANIVLMARTMKGNTQTIAKLAENPSHTPVPTSLSIEGPYGESDHLPNLANFDRILLIAGGVGATFILPLWKHAIQLRSSQGLHYQNIRLHWSVTRLQDAEWAFESINAASESKLQSDELELCVTGGSSNAADGGAAIELSSPGTQLVTKAEKMGFTVNSGRPALKQVVDQVMAAESGRVAVLVCGPPGMGRNVRSHVGKWVQKGNDVFWHSEEFGL